MFIVKLALAAAVAYFALPYLGVELTFVQSIMAAMIVQTIGFIAGGDTYVELTMEMPKEGD